MKRLHLLMLIGAGMSWAASPSNAATLRALTHADEVRVAFSDQATDDAGTVLFAVTNANPSGGIPGVVDQVVKWDLITRQASYVTNLPGGVTTREFCPRTCSYAPSVSDDGQWVAFMSADDPLGANVDGSTEVFRVAADGTSLVQVTNTQTTNTVLYFAMSGSGDRVVFVADRPGGNADLFAVNSDGSGLVHLVDRPGVAFSTVSISDDGTRIAFDGSYEIIPGLPSSYQEIYVVNSDATGLRRVTDSENSAHAWDPFISGDGNWVVYGSRKDALGLNHGSCDVVYLAPYGGGSLTQVTPECFGATQRYYWEHPSISDDGSTIYYDSDEPGSFNLDENFEIWRINPDGSGKQQITDTTSLDGTTGPVVAGGGGSVVFTTLGPFSNGMNPAGDPAVIQALADGSSPALVLAAQSADVVRGEYDMTTDGTRVVFVSDENPLGLNPDRLPQLFRLQADGSDLAQITALTDGEVLEVGIADDGNRIVYSATGGPAGLNPYCFENSFHNPRAHVYTILADGSGLLDLTPADCGGNYPSIAANGQFITYQGVRYGNLLRVRPDGTDLLELAGDHSWSIVRSRLDAGANWVVYQSSRNDLGSNGDNGVEIYRVQIDGSAREQLSASPALLEDGGVSAWPDVSASGDRVSWVSDADPFGTNADRNLELFLLEISTDTLMQLTHTSGVATDASHVAISGNGEWVYFNSGFDYFDPVVNAYFPFRVEVATGEIERVSGLEQAKMTLYPRSYQRDMSMAPDGSGDLAVLVPLEGNLGGENPDRGQEVWLADFSTQASISVGAPSPTLISWVADPRFIRYDVIRGSVGSLSDAGATIDLGAVVCVENESVDNHTAGFEVTEEPDVGEVFFYLFRGTPGGTNGPGSYGQGTGGKPRTASSGDCPS